MESMAFGFVLPCRALQGVTLQYFVAVEVAPSRAAELKRIIHDRFPALPVMSRGELVALASSLGKSHLDAPRSVAADSGWRRRYPHVHCCRGKKNSRRQIAILRALGARRSRTPTPLSDRVRLARITGRRDRGIAGSRLGRLASLRHPSYPIVLCGTGPRPPLLLSEWPFCRRRPERSPVIAFSANARSKLCVTNRCVKAPERRDSAAKTLDSPLH